VAGHVAIWHVICPNLALANGIWKKLRYKEIDGKAIEAVSKKIMAATVEEPAELPVSLMSA
jgi:hypothetical protein